MAVRDKVRQHLEVGDKVVFLDVKGDYRNVFFQEGDAILSPIENQYLWNVFEDLRKLTSAYELENATEQLVGNLYYGLNSEKEPFWTNAAKIITSCFIWYMLMEADVNDDSSKLNHYELCQLLDGFTSAYSEEDSEDMDECYQIYNSYRGVLNSYDKFKSANLFLPPLENCAMGPSVISEIMVMKRRLFRATFGEAIRHRNQRYISNATLPEVTFLEFNQNYREVCIPVFRCFMDMLINSYLDSAKRKKGKLYLILDELAILPQLDNLSYALSLGSGYGIRVVAGLQEIEQIRHNYQTNPHNAEVLLGAFQSQIVYNCDVHTADYIVKILGNAWIQRELIQAGGGIDYASPVQVPVIAPEELRNFEPGRALVHFEHSNAFIMKFPIYE